MNKEFNNEETLNNLYKLNNTQIQDINITSVGLLDSFGKLIIQINMKDGKTKVFEMLSPVPTELFVKWLKETNLVDKATYRQF